MGNSMPKRATSSRRRILIWALAVTIVVESATLWLRFGRGVQAAEFNKSAPLLLQIHHMFWSAPLLFIAPFLLGRPRIFDALIGISLGLIVSDLAHHFLILPLLTGTTGWHWP
jgi:hypothetical protein